MKRRSTGIRVFLLAMPVAAILLGMSVHHERGTSFLEEVRNAIQGNSTFRSSGHLPAAVIRESKLVARLIAGSVSPLEWKKSAVDDLAIFIVLKSRQHKISPYLVVSLIQVESSFRRSAISPKGAIGLMQLMPATAAEVAQRAGLPYGGPASLSDPKLNIELGLHYMLLLKRQFRSEEHVLTAYNMGPAALAKHLKNRKPLPFTYYQKVMDTLELLRREASPKVANSTAWL